MTEGRLRGDDTLVAHLLALLGLDVKVPTRATPQMRRAWERRALLAYLSSISAVLLVDGLDETQAGVRAEAENELRDIALLPGEHRLFLTCRSAEFQAPMQNTQIYTIRPLSKRQVEEFADKWLGEEAAPRFLSAVEDNPYAGTEVVPLTLAHLCAIYERDGQLPPRPIDVYEQIVSLLVEEWDKQRRVLRPSRYADFSWRKKERFLQAIAYHLALKGSKGSFREWELEQVYGDIAADFNLPLNESHEVIQEIESHTGLVQESGYRQYDFVHLVIQEFLSAMYAHRHANPVQELVPRFPNELALVVAYSSSPEAYLEEVLRGTLESWGLGATTNFVMPFLSRLAIERPVWRPSARLGWIILGFTDQMTRHFLTVDSKLRLHLPPEIVGLIRESRIAESIVYAATEAERFEIDRAFRLIPKLHASLPPALFEHLKSRSDPGVLLLKSDRWIQQIMKRRRKQAIQPGARQKYR